MNAVSFFLGYGATAPSTGTAKGALCDSIVRSGLRQFYWPAPLPGQVAPHYWTFLRPVSTINVVADVPILAGRTVTSSGTGNVTCTCNQSIFDQSMIGSQMTITGLSAAVTILSVTSATVATTSAPSGSYSNKTFSIDCEGYTLQDSFGGLIGNLYYTSNTTQTVVSVIGEAALMAMKAGSVSTTTGAPQFAAVRQLPSFSVGSGFRSQLIVYPEPDQTYELTYRMNVVPDCVVNTSAEIYGGAQHAETILESCLSIAEERVNDTQGVHRAKYMDRLSASIMIDRRQSPSFLGRYRDGDDTVVPVTRVTTVTVNGVQY